jgi:serine/threonine protein kinase
MGRRATVNAPDEPATMPTSEYRVIEKPPFSPAVDLPLEAYLGTVGDVFATMGGRSSGNVCYGVAVGPNRWFVKHAEQPEKVAYLENALRFHRVVSHPAIIPVLGAIRSPHGLATVSPWRRGEDVGSALDRFRALPVPEILAVLDTVFDAHLETTRHGFVAEDFYTGCILYDFQEHVAHLCDLDQYRPGPFRLERERQWGSSRFMAPEEFERGAVIDERTTVFTLGRAAFVFLGDGPQGGTDRALWRAAGSLYDVAMKATRPARTERYESVRALATAWRAAVAAGVPT